MKRFLCFCFAAVMIFIVQSAFSQNVGISSTPITPNYLLQIHHTAANGTAFQFTNNTTGNGINDGFQMNYIGTNFAMLNRENGNFSIYTNTNEKLRIMNDSGIQLINPVDYVYMNYSSTKGYPGYGFRSWNGQMQYKHKGGAWKDFPTMPNIPGNVEWWIRPTGADYIRPLYNPYIRVYDTLQTYGLYFDGAKNQYGGWFRTTGAYNPTAAVVGFSDVTGNQTYSFLGYNGTYTFAGQTIDGSGVYAYVDDPDRTAGFFRTTLNASVAANINYSNVWMANYNFVESGNSTYNPNASYSQLNVSADIPSFQAAVMTYSAYSGGSNVGYSVGGRMQGVGGAQDAIGVYGYASTTGSANTINIGGYFYATNSFWGSSAYAYVADEWNGRKITGTNSVSEIIPTPNHGRITMTCPESPEYWYIDYGSVQMVDGKAHVDLDPILADICVIDDENPIKVICQPNMPYCNGVAVINKSATGFDIVEMNGGTNSGEIDFQIVAKPKTNYGEGRFPQAPGPAYLKPENDPEAAKADNQPDRNNVYRWEPDWKVYNYNPEDFVEIGDVIPAGPNAGKVKLGNGKYADHVPLNKNSLAK